MIEAALVIAALYCGASYVWLFVTAILAMRSRPMTQAEMAQVELSTFHLGLCFILSVGFLGLLLK